MLSQLFFQTCLIVALVLAENTNEGTVESTHIQAICIGMSNFGQSFCRHAYNKHFEIIAAFYEGKKPFSNLGQAFESIDDQSLKNISLQPLSTLNDFLLHSKILENQKYIRVALVSIHLDLNEEKSIHLLQDLIQQQFNIATILNPELWYNQRQAITINELNRMAINVTVIHSGMAHFLYQSLPFSTKSKTEKEKSNKEILENMKIYEVFGRVKCNADFLTFGERDCLPNFWYEWMIGESVADYRIKQSELLWNRMIKESSFAFSSAFVEKYFTEKYDLDGNQWRHTFSTKAHHDKHGKTVSLFLNRIIETGKITGIRYNTHMLYDGDDANEENDFELHLIFTIGLFSDAKERSILRPCNIEWEFLGYNFDNQKRSDINLKFHVENVDIIRGMMDEALNSVIASENIEQVYEEGETARYKIAGEFIGNERLGKEDL